jgi:hypothetical protein
MEGAALNEPLGGAFVTSITSNVEIYGVIWRGQPGLNAVLSLTPCEMVGISIIGNEGLEEKTDGSNRQIPSQSVVLISRHLII